MANYNNQINNINSQMTGKKNTIDTTRIEIDYLATAANGTIIEIKAECSEYTSNNQLNGIAVEGSLSQINNTTYEYTINGHTYQYIYSEEDKAFVLRINSLCTKDNIADFMIPKHILNTVGKNFIVEFSDSTIKSTAIGQFKANYGEGQYIGDNNGKLPISRIYNIDHDINNIYFEFEQYWAGTSSNLTTTGSKTNENGCLLFSLINGRPIAAKDGGYNSQQVLRDLNNSAKEVISNARKSGVQINRNANTASLINGINISLTHNDNIGNRNQTYLIRITGGGAHNAVAIPAGIDKNGKPCWYLIDSDNALNANNQPKKHKLLFNLDELQNIAQSGNGNKASVGIQYT